MPKHSRLFNILFCRCPDCSEGKMFKPRWKFRWWDFGIMNNRCDKCNQSFTPEEGFYFGAAYMSYIMGVGLVGLSWLIMWKLKIDTTKNLLITIFLVLVFFSPYNFRLSRSAWLNFFGKIKQVAGVHFYFIALFIYLNESPFAICSNSKNYPQENLQYQNNKYFSICIITIFILKQKTINKKMLF